MSVVVPAVSERQQLEVLLNRRQGENLVLRLFVNDRVPRRADQLGDYREMVGQGYQAVNLAALDWALNDQGDVIMATQPRVRWVFEDGGPQTVYGFFMTWERGGLAWAERMKRPQTVEFAGDNVTVVPRYALRQMELA